MGLLLDMGISGPGVHGERLDGRQGDSGVELPKDLDTADVEETLLECSD